MTRAGAPLPSPVNASEQHIFRVHDTLSRSVVPFRPADPSRVLFYSCGPTVYDDAHIGNFRSFLAADLLRRWIESPLCALETADGDVHRGPREVVHVMNITDVGHMTEDDDADGGGQDKMDAAAQRLNEQKKSGDAHEGAGVDPGDPFSIADFYAGRFAEDARALGLKVAIESRKDATLMPRATSHVPGMIRVIEKLVADGAAYVVGEAGSRAVYFDTSAYDSYGSLSGNTTDALRAGAGGRVSDSNQATKRQPADFLLWKEDATHLMKWESPWGAGYPGWHIECTAMSLGRLIPGGLDRVLSGAGRDAILDIHSGGEDNIFPHHECERAQSCCATGAPEFARLWFHARFLMVDGAKMSKSKGTFFTPRQLMGEGVEPSAIRLELIKTHYRANADFSRQGLKDAGRMVERWRRFSHAAESSGDEGETNTRVRDEFAGAMSDDLNIAGAIGAVNSWVGATESPTRADARLMAEFDAVLGVLALGKLESSETGIGVFLGGLPPEPRVIELLEARRDAKKAKDFGRADTIRDELQAMGLSIKDVAGGKVEVSRL